MNKEPNTPEEILRNQNYIALTTFKKNGQGVTTPTWFVFDRDKILFCTFEKFWKVRRIRNNPNVEIAPAKARMGAPKDYKIIGKTIKGVARLLEKEEAKAAKRLLRKKYGFTYTVFNILRGISLFGSKLLFYEVIPKVLTD
jgi:PPOX class probable F420-dependent enzyme